MNIGRCQSHVYWTSIRLVFEGKGFAHTFIVCYCGTVLAAFQNLDHLRTLMKNVLNLTVLYSYSEPYYDEIFLSKRTIMIVTSIRGIRIALLIVLFCETSHHMLVPSLSSHLFQCFAPPVLWVVHAHASGKLNQFEYFRCKTSL